MSQAYQENQSLRPYSLQKGFSMIEVMIVMIIIGMFITYGAGKFVNKNNEMKASVRRFSTMVKKLRNRARLDNKTYRLVFDLPMESKKQQSYWVESTDKTALLLNEEQREELEDAVEDNFEGGTHENGEEKEPPDPQGFVTDTQVVKDAPATLPDSLYFESIEIDGDPIEKVSEGRVYIYFFPQGYVQQAAIHLTDRESLNWTLATRGVTGRVDIFNKFRSLEDIKDR